MLIRLFYLCIISSLVSMSCAGNLKSDMALALAYFTGGTTSPVTKTGVVGNLIPKQNSNELIAMLEDPAAQTSIDWALEHQTTNSLIVTPLHTVADFILRRAGVPQQGQKQRLGPRCDMLYYFLSEIVPDPRETHTPSGIPVVWDSCILADEALRAGFLDSETVTKGQLESIRKQLLESLESDWRHAFGPTCFYPLLFLYINAVEDTELLKTIWNSGYSSQQLAVMRVLSDVGRTRNDKLHSLAMELVRKIRDDERFHRNDDILRLASQYLYYACQRTEGVSFVRECLEKVPGNLYPELPRLALGLIMAHRPNTGIGDFVIVGRLARQSETMEEVLQYYPDTQEKEAGLKIGRQAR